MMLRRTFLTGATVAAIPTIPALAAQPKSVRETALWHMRELERLTKEAGAKSAAVFVVGHSMPDRGSACLMINHEGGLNDDDRMFGEAAI